MNFDLKRQLTYLFIVICNILFAQDVNLLPDTIRFCAGDSAFIEIKQNYDNYSSVYWNTPNGIITNTNKVPAMLSGKYQVKAFSAYFSKQLKDSCYVKILSRPRSALKDTSLCRGTTVLLNAKNEGLYYLWSTNEKTQKIKVSAAGKYWVKISNGVCSVTDTIFVRSISGSNAQLIGQSTFCLNDQNKTVSVKVNTGTKIMWNTGATSPSIAVTKEGTYWVTTEFNNCGPQTDSVDVILKVCECEMMIPNSFTPNEDGRNDYFFPVTECEYSYFSMSITDRWGNSIFTSNQINSKWDGRFKGNLCPEDIYIYKIESVEKGTDKKQNRSGHISLFR